MNLVLWGRIIFKENLTYEMACDFLKAANQTNAAKFMNFRMGLPANSKGDSAWIFFGESKELNKEFANNPEGFVIENLTTRKKK